MLILVNGSTKLIKQFGPSHLGSLIVPDSYDKGQNYIKLSAFWAMDNGCFTGLHRIAFTRMLKNNQSVSRSCLWVTVPDVVGNASATLARFKEWSAVVRGFGYPLAFVAQDGIEETLIPWKEFDCLFIGGSTGFKIGPMSERYTKEAKQRGKWVHMGRASTPKRLHLAGSWGCDSVDSTGFSRAGMKHLPWALEIAKQYSNQIEKGA